MNSRTFRGVGAFISAGALVATVSIAGCGDSDGSNQRDVELPSPDHVDATMVAETVLSMKGSPIRFRPKTISGRDFSMRVLRRDSAVPIFPEVLTRGDCRT